MNSRRPVPKALRATGHKGMVYREPYGVTLIIGPFNGPLLLLLRPAIAALAAGNTCILKLIPSLTATSALLLELIAKYFDPRAVAAVLGGRDDTTELLKLPFNFIFFTGSTKVGKVVARAAAENLTPTLLELGGQNPAIVDQTANIANAAKKIAWGAMAWGGAWCTSPGYAYVHESVAEQFVGEAKKAVVEMYGSDPRNNPDYSRIISAKEVSRLASLIDPKKVVYGGKSDPEARYLDPTIIYPVSWEDHIMEDEVFGPILPILAYKTLDATQTPAHNRASQDTPLPLAEQIGEWNLRPHGQRSQHAFSTSCRGRSRTDWSRTVRLGGNRLEIGRGSSVALGFGGVRTMRTLCPSPPSIHRRPSVRRS
jgi:aldehyde dehydrogenase (NAD+)